MLKYWACSACVLPEPDSLRQKGLKSAPARRAEGEFGAGTLVPRTLVAETDLDGKPELVTSTPSTSSCESRLLALEERSLAALGHDLPWPWSTKLATTSVSEGLGSLRACKQQTHFSHCCASAVRVLSQAGHGLRLQFTAP